MRKKIERHQLSLSYHECGSLWDALVHYTRELETKPGLSAYEKTLIADNKVVMNKLDKFMDKYDNGVANFDEDDS